MVGVTFRSLKRFCDESFRVIESKWHKGIDNYESERLLRGSEEVFQYKYFYDKLSSFFSRKFIIKSQKDLKQLCVNLTEISIVKTFIFNETNSFT